jgi:hypothetical protein
MGAKGWTTGVLGFDSRQKLGIFLFTAAPERLWNLFSLLFMDTRASLPGGKADGA